MKRCSASLSIRGMQIKNAVRYHLTPVRMTTIKKYINIMLARMWRKGGPPILLVEMYIGAATVTAWRSP